MPFMKERIKCIIIGIDESAGGSPILSSIWDQVLGS
jgi:hypothetical protein